MERLLQISIVLGITAKSQIVSAVVLHTHFWPLESCFAFLPFSQNAKWHMEVLDKYYDLLQADNAGLQHFATVYCATIPLKNESFG